jgi:5-methylthioadenosine/S-adenosylhomocysteine deaminase
MGNFISRLFPAPPIQSNKPKLIRNGTIVTFTGDSDEPIVGSYDILIVRDRIAKIEPRIILPTGQVDIIDATDKIIIPGFIDTHRHVWQSLFKGMMSDWTLAEYIGKNLSVLAELLEPEDVYAAQMAGALEALNAGSFHFSSLPSGMLPVGILSCSLVV